MMATQSSLQDCYFYFYSSCTKGDECPFRHCELALGTETVCSLWREGRCFRSNCKFRHMESRINRSMIPCYWENQPGGCRKPHCVFFHRKLRNGAQEVKSAPGLILPTSDVKTSPKLPDSTETSNAPCNVPLVEKDIEGDNIPDPSLTPVPPLVLNFDEGEESDTESVSSTPVKQGDKKTAITRNNLSIKELGSAEEKDFGIKTLEQIRMEKIHKESDSYYGAAYTSAPLESPRLIDQHYPPKTEFIALSKDSALEKNLPAPIVEPKLSGVDEETDLRGRLSNRRNIALNKVNQVRLINFKKQNANQVEVVPKKLDFKIKTLEEIRKEKENKQSKSEVTSNNSLSILPSLEKKPVNNMKEKTFRKLKINRKPKELNPVPAIPKNDASAPNLTDMTATHLSSNGLKKEVPKSSEAPKKTSSDSPGKRKIDDDSSTSAPKIIKLVTTANGNWEQDKTFRTCSEEISEEDLQSAQHPKVQLPSASETSTASSHIQTSTSFNLKQEDTMDTQNSGNDTEINGVITSTLSSPKSTHMLDKKTVPESADNECILKDEISDKTLHSVSSNIKSDPSNDNGIRKDNVNLIDRSMSVDDDLDEFLGDDDMNMDEMDATPNDDILLQIEEFLES